MNSTSPTSRPSRLTRSTTDRKISGVAGGLASYFDVDPLLVRISFGVATLFSGLGLVAYIAMLAFVPSDSDAPAGAHAVAA
jgi:phage shock protein PspC (stress-responsive transcriptional regulator)